MRVAKYKRRVPALRVLAPFILVVVMCHLNASELVIYSATDRRAMEPVLQGFQMSYPDITIFYVEYDTIGLHETVYNGTYEIVPDLVLSSAMDLQSKLVNDGYARPFRDPVVAPLPRDSHWRSELFGFTYEPIVFVYNRNAFAGRSVPRTHDELASMLRSDEDFFMSRVGTYDIRRAGVGYLVATQDDLRSSIAWRLNESLGRVNAEATCCSQEILEAVAGGGLIFGYNILSSYAMEYTNLDPRLGIVFPEDYTLTISRLAFIYKNSVNADNAALFLRYLLSLEGQQVMAEKGGLLAIHPQAVGPFSLSALQESVSANLHIIEPGPPLLVYLDQSKRRLFLREWESALLFRENMTPQESSAD